MHSALSSSDRREVIQLLIEFEGLSRAAARRAVNEATSSSLSDTLFRLRRLKLERNGQQSMKLPLSSPVAPPKPKSRAKKVPYTLLLPPEQLDALRAISDADDSSVSHHIRQAIRIYLRSR